ncbi:hypothetical protein BDW69DRAFT_39660 [Aspergillus filifer]
MILIGPDAPTPYAAQRHDWAEHDHSRKPPRTGIEHSHNSTSCLETNVRACSWQSRIFIRGFPFLSSQANCLRPVSAGAISALSLMDTKNEIVTPLTYHLFIFCCTLILLFLPFHTSLAF